MAYDIKTRNIYYPDNYKIYYHNNIKAKFTKELFDLNNNILKDINKINSSLIYVIYLPMKDNKYIKIGYANSTYEFLKKDGRFDIHTKSFNCDQPPLLLKVFKIKERQIEIELKLHRYIKETFSGLHYKVPFIKDGNECKSNETYLFDRDVFRDLGNIIQSIHMELNQVLGKSNSNKGYIKDDGFIDNKIIYDTIKRPRLEINKVYEVDENQEIKDKFKPSEEVDKTNLEKYTGYESDDGFIVDDSEEISDYESSESEEYESSESSDSDDSQSIVLRKRLKKCSS